MPLTSASTLVRRARPALAVAAIVCAGALTQPALAQAAPATTPAPLGAANLLQIEDLRADGVSVDSAQQGIRGDQLLGDAGRFDEGCLGEKTLRNITNAKAYPAPATTKGYADGVWTSTRDKEVWANESIAEGKTAAATDRYVGNLFDEIGYVQDCEQDPAQGNHYGKPRTVKVGTATATYFLDYTSDGRTDGGGVAVIRDGNRFGFVSLMSAPGTPGVTLKKLASTAAANLR